MSTMHEQGSNLFAADSNRLHFKRPSSCVYTFPPLPSVGVDFHHACLSSDRQPRPLRCPWPQRLGNTHYRLRWLVIASTFSATTVQHFFRLLRDTCGARSNPKWIPRDLNLDFDQQEPAAPPCARDPRPGLCAIPA